MTALPSLGELRRRHLGAALRGRPSGAAQIGLALVALGGPVLAIAGRPEALLLLPAAAGGWIVLLWWLWHVGDAAAKNEWLTAWGARHGLRYSARRHVLEEATALLRRGMRRQVLRTVHGDVGGRAVIVAHYTYWEEVGKQQEAHPFSLCSVELPETAQALPVLRVEPRGIAGGLFDGVRSAFTSRRVIDHESAQLDAAYRIAVDDRQDELALRRVLTPSFMVWLEGLGDSDLRIELEQGVLVVARPGHRFDADGLDWFLGAGTEIARRLAAVPHESSQEASP